MATAVEKIRERARKNGIELSDSETEKEQKTTSAAERIRERAEKNFVTITVDGDTISARRKAVIPSSYHLLPGTELGAHGRIAERPSRMGETRREGTKTGNGETIPGARWDPSKRQVNATVRSADEIRADIAAVEEEIRDANHGSIKSDFGVLFGGHTNSMVPAERIAQLNENRKRLRQELAANRSALRNNADFAEKNQADSGFAAMTDDDMYRLVNYPEEYSASGNSLKNIPSAERALINSPTQGIEVNETLKNLIDPIYAAVYNDAQYIRNMTDEERQNYNYLYKTEGRTAADEYLELIRDGLTARYTEETNAKVKEFAEEHPVLSSAYTVATLPAKGASALGGSLGTYLSGQELDRNGSYNVLANASSEIRRTVSDRIEENWGKFGSAAYNIGMSMADFLAMGVIGKGSQIPLAILGSNAAADMTISALDRGVSDGKAIALGLIAGFAEAAAEKVGIDNLFKSQYWSKNSLRYILQNAFGEFLEEGGTSLVNSLADILISRDKSEWQQSINAYREQGFTDKEAFDNTLKDTAIMIGLDALGGAISGGLMAGGGVAVGKIGQGAVNRENVREAQETWREVRKENERSQAAKTAAAIEANGFEETGTEEPIIISRPSATTEGEEFEIGREVRRDQLMTLEQQEKADAIDAAEDDLTATALKYDATPRQINEARELSELTGYSVEFFRQKNPNGTTKNGMYDSRSRRIYLNVNSKRTVATTIAHEITHSLEDSASYEVLHDLVLGIKQVQGTDIDAERAEVRNLYEKAGKTLKGNREIDADIVAEYVGTELLDDVRAIREVYRENPSVGRKIASVIDKMLIKATGMQDMTVKSYLERASAMYQQAEKIAENAGEAERLREENEKAQRMTETARATGRSFATEEMEDRARDLRRRTYVKANELEVDRKEAAQRKKAEEEHTEKRAREISEGRISRTREKNLAADALLEDMLKKYQQGKITRREFESFYDRYDAAQRESERYTESALRDVMSGNLTDDQLSERLEWAAQMRDPAYVRRESNFKKTAESEDAARRGSDADFLRYITENSADMPRWKLDSLLEEYTERLADTKPQKTPEPKRSDVVNAYSERQEARERGESDWSNIETNPSRMVPQNAAEPATEESAAEYLRRISLEVPESERADLTAVADEAERTQQSAKKAADAIRISAYDAFDNDEIDEETRDARLNIADEIEFTGRGIESSADIVDYPEGRIPEWVRGKAGAIREKLGIKPKKPVQYSISAEEMEDRVFSGRPVEAADEVQWSLSNDASYMDAAERENEKNRYVPYNVMAKARDDRETIRKIFTDPRLADSLNLPPDNIGNTYIPNGSYDGTEENTTVCIRSMAADALMDAVAEHLGRPLTVEDTITVSQEYWQYTDQPECLYCYVAMDRKAYREFLGSYLEQRNNALADLRSGMDRGEAYDRYLDGRKDTKPQRERFRMWERALQNGTGMITEADLASERSMQDAAARSPELAAQINDARKYAQGASWAKKRIGYTAYNNHILKWTPDRIRKLNSQFGLRLYSFSDFSPAFILENMQMITDASVRGLKMLGYTKDINFAKIFAPSGININISTFAYEGADGTMVQDGMQGADWSEAQALRDRYGNVGITFVAVNDAQVEWALAQDWVDVVIPFHLVRTGAKVAEHFGWKNYTQMSSDVKTKDWTKGDKKSIYPSEHQNDRERYFEALRKNHLEPRFREWADNPNYMKLVNETRRSARETPAVQPVFDVDAAKAAIEEMRRRGGYYVPVGKTDENMRDIAGEIADKIRGEERWSISEEEDRRYINAARSGDTESAQKMVDKAAKAAGYDVDAFHGTDGGDFYVFDWDKTQSTDGGFFGRGHYFTKYRGVAQQYGERVVEAKLNLGKTFVWSEEVNTYNGIRPPEILSRNIVSRINLAKHFPDIFADQKMSYFEYDEKRGEYVDKNIKWENLEDVINAISDDLILRPYADGTFKWHTEGRFWEVPVGETYSSEQEAEDGKFFAAINALKEKYDGLFDTMSLDDQTTYTQAYGSEITEILKKNGYDSAMDTPDGGEIVVFDSSRIKSAAPITYDESGKIIPLSERFKRDNSDIRYSVSEDEDTTPYGGLPVKAQNRVRDLERKFGVAMDKMFGLGMTYKSPDFRQFLADNVRPLVNTYLENGSIPQEESDALFRSFYNPLSGTDEDLQRQEFYSAFEQMEEGLRNATRFAGAQNATEDTEAPENPMPTTEEAEELFRVQRDARREMDKVMAKLLLTPQDEVTVGELLRGTKSEDQITENRHDILEAYRVQKAFRDADAAVSVYKKRLKAELYKHVDKYLGNIASWKDKRMPLMYQRETMERNIRDIIPDKAEADAFIAEFLTPVHRAEAQRQRFLGEYRERVQKLNLSTKVEKGNQQSEAYAVQFLGEAADNIRILSLSGKIDQQRDGHTLEEWKAAVEAFWAANPNMNRAKIDSAIGEFRQIYNELLPKLNEVRIRNGYAPVAFRQGYFPHFTATSEDTVLARILRPFGIEFNADALPTSINGLTADFKPGITYFQFGNERLGFETTYDALQGYEMYLNAASDVIYHTDNIQKLRALAARIRYLTGDEGIKQQIDKVRNNDTLDEAEKQVQLEEIYRKGRYRMSNFVVTMDEYTNGLANKKSRFDRGVEELFGRPAYSVMKALESRVARNMIAGNIGSALTNIIPLNQANAIIGNVNVLKGMYHTIHGMAVHDGFAAASDFLTNRRGADPLVRTFGQKLSDKASIPMNLIDGFVSETIVRAAYTKNLADGMGEDLALQHADALAASIMADRSKGALPVLFNARNPLMKLFTQFQLEVNNEYSVIFKDIPELAKANSETKAGAIARITGMLFRYFVGAWLFNELYEKLFGRRAALDPVGMIANTVGSVAEGEDVGKALQTLGTEAAESLPFIGGVLGGGRVPIQSALPDFSNLTMAATSDTWTGKKKALTAFEELSKPAAYLLPPFGGGQIQKMLRGGAAALQGGVYGVEGDEDGGTYLKYPVYDDWQDRLNAIVFGTTYTEGGREWVNSGFKSLSVKQTTAYQAMKEFGADDRAAYDLIQAYKSVPDGEGRSAAQRDVIRSAGIPGGAKYAAYYNLGASDARRALMDAITDTEPEANLGEAAEVLMDISDIRTGKTAGVCDLLAQSGLAEDTKKLIYRQEVSDQRGDDITAAEWAGITFDEYLDAHGAYSAIGNKDLSKAEQALEFARYVEGMSLSDSQKDTVREIFRYYSQIPVQAKGYNELRDIGISDDYAAKLVRAVDALEPLPGEKSVSSIQKARVVVDTISDADDRLAALGTVLSDSQFRKVSIAAGAGLDPEVWVAFREILPEFDSDANGSYTQEEMEDAIRAFSNGSNYGTTLMKAARNLSRDEMAILWQIGGSWKSANNPFSKTTGKYVKDLLDAEKKG